MGHGAAIAARDGDFVVSARDLPEVVTSGDTLEELSNCRRCVEAIVSWRMENDKDLPPPSRVRKGEHPVPLPARLAAKASVYSAWKSADLTKVELARRLGRNEVEVRRILDPKHGTKIDQLDEAAPRSGRQAQHRLRGRLTRVRSRAGRSRAAAPGRALRGFLDEVRAARSAECRRCGNIRARRACRCAPAPARPDARPSANAISAVATWRGFRSAMPRMVTFSSPFRPRLCQLVPSSSTSGSTPMPTRLERWMRSKLCAITARTPSSRVPLAAQSREEPVPYSLPAKMTSGTFSVW